MPENMWNRSYFNIDATDWGWDNPAPFFSGYIELQLNLDAPERKVEAVVVGFIVAVLLLGNLGAVTMISVSSRLRKTLHILLLNLCIPSLIYGIVHGAIAITTRHRGDWYLGDAWCRLTVYLAGTSGLVSIGLQMVIGIVRHQKFVPKADKSPRKPVKARQAAMMCSGVWTLHLSCLSFVAYCTRTYVVSVYNDVGNTTISATICVIGFPNTGGFRVSYIYSFYVFFIGFLTPFCVTVFCNIRILRHVKAENRRLLEHTDSGVHRGGAQEQSLPLCEMSNTTRFPASKQSSYANNDGRDHLHQKTNIFLRCFPCRSQIQHRPQHLPRSVSTNVLLARNKQQAKISITLLIILVMFACGWIPAALVILYCNFQLGKPHPTGSGTDAFWAIVPSLMSAAINPFLYGLVSDNFKAIICDAISKIRNRK